MNTKNGFYLTFVHLLCENIIRSFPMYILVSSKFLQTYYPSILLKLVTTPTGNSTADIKVINTTPFNISVTSLSLSKDAPSNIQIQMKSQPIIFPKFSSIVIGKVILFGSKEGEIKTFATVTYEVMSKNIVHTFDIPIHGSVIYGELTPNKKQIQFLLTSKKIKKIHFVNNFNVPVAILIAKIDSTIFKILNFTPSLVLPGEKSQDIIVKYSLNHEDKYSFNAKLTIITNATNYDIPVCSYNGKLTISKTNEHFTSQIFKNFGKVFCLTTNNFTFYLKNSNPTGFLVTNYTVSNGISVKGFWNGNKSLPILNHVIPPFSVNNLTIFITFNNVISELTRIDSFMIGNNETTIQVLFQWSPISGNIQVSTTLPVILLYGCNYSSEIYFESNYLTSFKLNSFTTNTNSVNLNALLPIIRPKFKTSISKMNFLVDYNLMKSMNISNLFNFSLDFNEQIKLWKTWKLPYQRNIPLFIGIKGNQGFYKSKITLNISYIIFPPSIINIGTIFPMSYINATIRKKNYLDSYVEFRINGNNNTKPWKESFIANPNSYIDLNFAIRFSDIGKQHCSIPITTNATPPFYVYVKADIVLPKILFINDIGQPLSSLNFSSNNSIINRNWKKTIFLRNEGKINVTIGKFMLNSTVFSFVSNCKSILQNNNSCEVNISVLPLKIKNELEESILSIYSHGIKLSCNLKVEVTKNDIKLLREIDILITFVIILFGSSGQLCSIVFFCRRSMKSKREMKNRLQKLVNECNKLTKSTKSTTSTQTETINENLCGKWIDVPGFQMQISDEAFSQLNMLLD